MGIFETLDEKKFAGPIRKDCPDGVYWVRVDNISKYETRDKGEILRVAATIVRSLNPEAEGQPGQEVTMPFYQGHYLEKELGQFLQAAFDLTQAERGALTKAEVESRLTGGDLHGQVLQITSRVMISKNSGKPFSKITWNNNVPVERLQDKLDEATIETYFPAGLE